MSNYTVVEPGACAPSITVFKIKAKRYLNPPLSYLLSFEPVNAENGAAWSKKRFCILLCGNKAADC
jgi:hypothetical protein